MGIFGKLKAKYIPDPPSWGTTANSSDAPPEWQPAPEQSHDHGLYNEASDSDFESAGAFCRQYPPEGSRLLSSDIVERIEAEGCRAWGLGYPRSQRWAGSIKAAGEKGGKSLVKVVTEERCREVCLMSDLPIMGGLYDTHGKTGIYYEVLIHKMDGIIAIGTTCLPYPDWRFPGWERLSAGLHLDDMRKFFEDPDGGRDYSPLLSAVSPGDTFGCGYDFTRNSVFFTFNGQRLPDAFTGLYVPRHLHDVYAAIGVEGACEFDVNFGGELFRWKEGNEWAWRVEGHVGRLTGPSGGDDGELPTYNEVRYGTR
ncbi:hypothetical protein BXZ70DRAFT_1005037 [Cristinia sonorae]|uniref:B30.2/SPRY domain-containing protein n=1 Tax=Cristinia sonorae TaxID=1940300 RepID=A0A8K0UU72_9AGAR|nr:hypothetical protein BXZ70DRAFT_1005037 [Cristinia sonorae]